MEINGPKGDEEERKYAKRIDELKGDQRSVGTTRAYACSRYVGWINAAGNAIT